MLLAPLYCSGYLRCVHVCLYLHKDACAHVGEGVVWCSSDIPTYTTAVMRDAVIGILHLHAGACILLSLSEARPMQPGRLILIAALTFP